MSSVIVNDLSCARIVRKVALGTDAFNVAIVFHGHHVRVVAGLQVYIAKGVSFR